MTKYSLEEMLKRDYGRILLIASIAGKEAREGVVTFIAILHDDQCIDGNIGICIWLVATLH